MYSIKYQDNPSIKHKKTKSILPKSESLPMLKPEQKNRYYQQSTTSLNKLSQHSPSVKKYELDKSVLLKNPKQKNTSETSLVKIKLQSQTKKLESNSKNYLANNITQQKYKGSMSDLGSSLNLYKEKHKSHSISLYKEAQMLRKEYQLNKFSSANTIKRPPVLVISKANDKGMEKSVETEELQKIRKFRQKAISGTCVYKRLNDNLVSAYTVSSQFGTLSSHNYCRVCMVPYLNKNYKKKNLSFFGLYEGNTNAEKAQYMRENLHHFLVQDQFLYYNFEKALCRSIEKIEKDLTYLQKFASNYSTVSFILCVIVGQKIYLVRGGHTNCSISANLGSYIRSLQTKRKKYHPLIKKPSMFNTLEDHTPQIFEKQTISLEGKMYMDIDIKQIDYHEGIDFVILGSEGIFDTLNQPAKLIWRNLLNYGNNINITNFTSKLGQSAGKFCHEAIQKDSLGRSMTVILICFESLINVFDQSYNYGQVKQETCHELELPHVLNQQTEDSIIKREQIQ